MCVVFAVAPHSSLLTIFAEKDFLSLFPKEVRRLIREEKERDLTVCVCVSYRLGVNTNNKVCVCSFITLLVSFVSVSRVGLLKSSGCVVVTCLSQLHKELL